MEFRKGCVHGGETLLIDGPASVRILSGEGNIFGAKIAVGEQITVRKGKRIPLTVSSGKLRFEAKVTGILTLIKGDTIPPSWRNAAEAAIRGGGRAIVFGDVDTGKTGFCTYLANRALQRLDKVGYVDGDIGQPEIGPPTTVTATILNKQHYTLSRLDPTLMHFVGHTSPSFCQERVVEAVERSTIGLEVECSKMLTINTDGWVRDEGLLHKAKMVKRLKPNTVLSFLSNEENSILVDGVEAKLMRLTRPEHIRPRTQEERRDRRESAYRAYFSRAERRRIDLEKILLYDPFLQLDESHTHSHVLSLARETGLLVGLIRDELTIGLGIVLKIDQESRALEILCRIEKDKEYDRIELGRIRLDKSFRESICMFYVDD
ncbi:MAG: Clp1/GlmU family protein [Thermoproteota archaeon]